MKERVYACRTYSPLIQFSNIQANIDGLFASQRLNPGQQKECNVRRKPLSINCRYGFVLIVCLVACYRVKVAVFLCLTFKVRKQKVDNCR